MLQKNWCNECIQSKTARFSLSYPCTALPPLLLRNPVPPWKGVQGCVAVMVLEQPIIFCTAYVSPLPPSGLRSSTGGKEMFYSPVPPYVPPKGVMQEDVLW